MHVKRVNLTAQEAADIAGRLDEQPQKGLPDVPVEATVGVDLSWG
jgi:hypothetical protein